MDRRTKKSASMIIVNGKVIFQIGDFVVIVSQRFAPMITISVFKAIGVSWINVTSTILTYMWMEEIHFVGEHNTDCLGELLEILNTVYRIERKGK